MCISVSKYNKLILLIGEDNLAGFNNWKDYKKIIEIAEVYVYPRDTNQKYLMIFYQTII